MLTAGSSFVGSVCFVSCSVTSTLILTGVEGTVGAEIEEVAGIEEEGAGE